MAISVPNPNRTSPRQVSVTPSADSRRKKLSPIPHLIHDRHSILQEQAMSRTWDPKPAKMARSSRKDAEGDCLPQGSLLSVSAECAPHPSQNPRLGNGLAPEILVAALKATYEMDLERSDKILRTWDTVSRCFGEISSAVNATSYSAREANGRMHDKEYRQSTSHSRQSWEWETETLVDPASCSIDRDSFGRASSTRPGNSSLYPCPFRKRNPVRFNVRDHERCAKAPFGTIQELRWVSKMLSSDRN
jgi:hypothetical protein